MEQKPNIDLTVGAMGIVSDDVSFDPDTDFTPKQPVEESREVKIRVPSNIPDHVVYNAWQIGMGTVQRLNLGLGVFAFPSIQKGPDGKMINVIGKAEMIISKPEDVQRILKVIQVINDINNVISQTANRPADLLTATVEGKRAKDEAVRQAIQEAGGQPALVIASEEPKASRKSIIR